MLADEHMENESSDTAIVSRVFLPRTLYSFKMELNFLSHTTTKILAFFFHLGYLWIAEIPRVSKCVLSSFCLADEIKQWSMFLLNQFCRNRKLSSRLSLIRCGHKIEHLRETVEELHYLSERKETDLTSFQLLFSSTSTNKKLDISESNFQNGVKVVDKI